MYQREFYIGSGDADRFQEAKLSSIFRMFQEVATEHAEQLGVGKSETLDKGQGWIITRMYVEIYRYPMYEEKVIFKTYPGQTKMFIFPRYFQIESTTGEVLARCSSLWCVLNQIERKVSFKPFGNKELVAESYDNELEQPMKVNNVEKSKLEDRRVRYSDTDLNGHLNNTKYIEYIIDAFSPEFYKSNRIKSILINYNKEIQADDIVEISVGKSDKGTVVSGKINNENSFDAELVFVKR